MGVWASESSGGGTTTVISGSTYPGHIPAINDWAAFLATSPDINKWDVVNFSGTLYMLYTDTYTTDMPVDDTTNWGQIITTDNVPTPPMV